MHSEEWVPSSWLGRQNFDSFSVETNTALTSVLTSKARDEIVKSLSTLMLVHTMHPTSDDYDTMQQAHQETLHTQGSHWKWLCKCYAWNSKICVSHLDQRKSELKSPQLPKIDTTESAAAVPSASDEAAYDKASPNIYDSQKWRLMSLMEETAEVRRQWITNECPPVNGNTTNCKLISCLVRANYCYNYCDYAHLWA